MEKDLVAHRTVNVEATHRSSHLKKQKEIMKNLILHLEQLQPQERNARGGTWYGNKVGGTGI